MCCPSRATIMTGLYSHHTHVENNQDKSKFDDKSTIATWLDAAGYRTGLFGKYHLGTHGEEADRLHPARVGLVGLVPRRCVLQLHAERERKARPLRVDAEGLLDGRAGRRRRSSSSTPLTPRRRSSLYLALRSPHDGYQPASGTRMRSRRADRAHRRPSTRPTCPTSRAGGATSRRARLPTSTMLAARSTRASSRSTTP